MKKTEDNINFIYVLHTLPWHVPFLYQTYFISQIENKGPNWTFLLLTETLKMTQFKSLRTVSESHKKVTWCYKTGQHFSTAD